MTFKIEDIIPNEEVVVVTISHLGYIKRTQAGSEYRIVRIEEE